MTKAKPNLSPLTTPIAHQIENNGIALNVLEWNPQGVVTCLCFHGFTNDAMIWQDLATALIKDNYRVLALDFRGHGDSDWCPQSNYSHQHLLGDIKALVHTMGIKDAHIIGHSLGARVAALWLAESHYSARSFTIIDTGPDVGKAAVEKVRVDAESSPSSFRSHAEYLQFMQAIYVFAEPEALRQYCLTGLRTLPDGTLSIKTDPNFTRALWQPASETTKAMLSAPLKQQLWDALAQLQMPCLILKGQISAILKRPTAEKMLRQINDAELHIITRAGHALMLDNPTEFRQQLIDFIKAR